MGIILDPGPRRGTVGAIASKSQAHRLLLCAALSDRPSFLQCSTSSRDIEATAACLAAMGARIERRENAFLVSPVGTAAASPDFPCGESGSTLRFLLPVAGALGLHGRFLREGRLPERPLGPLRDALEAHGMHLREDGPNLHFTGQLQGGAYRLPGNISSQYLSGLLFALPLLPSGSRLRITTAVESRAYLQMTLDALQRSGIRILEERDSFSIPGGQRPRLPEGCSVEGDWSNAAPFLCAGAIGGPVTVTGLRPETLQGDRRILDVLRRFGARVETECDAVTVSRGILRGIEIDGSEIPDLIPVLCAVAAAAEGDTRVVRAGRLRLKESDRLTATAALLTALGGSVEEQPEGLIVHGRGSLRGGRADAAGDHRMAMTAAVCALCCREAVEIPGEACVEKSYPGFFEDWNALIPG